jgi:hypothetical protein
VASNLSGEVRRVPVEAKELLLASDPAVRLEGGALVLPPDTVVVAR